MPGLDYANEVPPSTGGVPVALLLGRPDLMSYYDRSCPDRTLVRCPDCRRPADPRFGDHGGDCRPGSRVARDARDADPTGALGIIRRAALTMPRLSVNELRSEFDRAAVKETARGPAFAAATRRGWIEADGSIPSTDPATHGHRVQTYRSLLHTGGA